MGLGGEFSTGDMGEISSGVDTPSPLKATRLQIVRRARSAGGTGRRYSPICSDDVPTRSGRTRHFQESVFGHLRIWRAEAVAANAEHNSQPAPRSLFVSVLSNIR
jgi:hypothetical protein